jgi:hypothetical protein
MRYRVNDIYDSIQGEGIQTGVPMIVLRLHGCAVGCPWCDTRQTWQSDPVNRVDELEQSLGEKYFEWRMGAANIGDGYRVDGGDLPRAMRMESDGQLQIEGAVGGDWNTPSFNQWSSYGDTYMAVRYRRFGDMVFVKGLARALNSRPNNTTMFTLPAGFRPPKRAIWSAMSYNGSTTASRRIDVHTDGTIKCYDAYPTNGWVSFDGLFFYLTN